ncbi:MAG: HAMP domain-containing sensor histidine kinase [Bacteroidales bacterium]|nr:HAMP domain-containing sensor histidine kinase [Bacteroidales bacterium]
MEKLSKKITSFIRGLVDFGVDDNLPYLEARKAKLLNVAVWAISIILVIFLVINLIEKNYFLAISDILLFVFVCIPSWILQYKRKYKANLLLIISAFLIYTTLLTILKYDVNRQTEHILPALSILVIFLFDGWKKNLIFILFPISFFTIRFVVMYQTYGIIELKTLHLIYFIEFLSVYIVTNYFKADMLNFYDKLQKTIDTKDKLFQIISHDIKNPFSSLLGTSELQLRFAQNKELEKFEKSSKIIHSSASRIYDLTQSLLDWSSTQTESLDPKIKNINITKLIEDVIGFCDMTAIPKEIELVFDNKKTVLINCDAVMTQIAIRNIIMNAIKFSHRNSKIVVSQSVESSGVLISIEDFGVGIDPVKLENIFDEDFLHSSYGTEKEKGTGLGLKITKELIEKQNGRILVESTVGKGSTFKIFLPN